MNANHYVAIMAGGVGSRFWPGSRESKPKQFLDILGVGKSMIRTTYERFLPLIPAGNIFVVTHEMYRDLVKAHIPELGDHQIICEPSRNNTAPSVAYTALKLYGINPEANFVMAPSDHVILKEEVFLRNVKAALAFTTKHDALLTLGIQPTRPDTGYGYIQYEVPKTEAKDSKSTTAEVRKVEQFREKPDVETAKDFLRSGNYLWNAGIFIWKAKDILNAFKMYAEDIYGVLEPGASQFDSGEKEQSFIASNYPKTRSVSIDYAIMEKAENVYTIPSDFGWSDLGTWASLHSEAPKDARNNLVQGGETLLEEVSNCLIRVQDSKLTSIRGLDDFIVIDEADVLIIYPKSKEQDIKKVTEGMRKRGDLEKFL